MVGILIITPILFLLGGHYYSYLREVVYYFPYHLLRTAFCFITLLLYSIYIFKNKKIKIASIIISILIILIMTIMAFTNKIIYKTILISNEGENDVTFNDKYSVYLEDNNIGKV